MSFSKNFRFFDDCLLKRVALLGWKILVEDLGNLLSQINYY